MRKPKQVLVFLYRKNKYNEHEYCIFYRDKLNFWQGLSGGVENDETLFETVKREVLEETGIRIENQNILQLSSVASIPVVSITGKFTWGKDIYVVHEYSFGILVNKENIKISNEHVKYEWVSYNKAYELLKFDSNKIALWELNQRIQNKNLND